MSDNNKILQLFYAGVLADSVSHYEKAGILEKVTEIKKIQQGMAAHGQLKHLEINSVEDLFEKFSKIFGCVDWTVTPNDKGLKATGYSCLLCSISKRIGSAQPCQIYCINPLRSLVEAIESSTILEVNETLWDGTQCEFIVKNQNR